MAKPAVLVVEDDPLMSVTIRDALEDAGYTVIGPAATLPEGVMLARTSRFQAAILDYDLGGEPVIPVAWDLHRRNIPVLVFSGLARP